MELLTSVRWGELLGSLTHETSCLILAAMALLVMGLTALRLRLFETAGDKKTVILPSVEDEGRSTGAFLQFHIVA